MEKLLRSLMGIAIASLSSCATHYAVNPVRTVTANPVYQNGMARLVSMKRNGVVIGPTSQTIEQKKQKEFLVIVWNRTGRAFDFDSADVQVEYFDSTKNVTTGGKVYSYEELVKKEKNRQAWAAVGAGLSAAGDSMNAANAGYSNTHGNYSGNTYSSNGGTSFSGNYSATTYDYAAANSAQNAARDRASSNANELAARGKENLEYLSALTVKRETVFPGKKYGGMIRFEIPPLADTGKIRFRVNAGGDVHVLEFDLVKQ